MATTTSAYSLYLQARLLILRQAGLIDNRLAFLTHVLEVGLLALSLDLVIKIADVVDNACGALIRGIDLDYTILNQSSSSKISCSNLGPSHEFLLPEPDRQLLNLILHFEDLALLLRILVHIPFLTAFKFFHALI